MDLKQSKEPDVAKSAAVDPPKRQSLVPLLVVLAVALGLRLWGIGWGLSSSRHYFSYHPDENAVLFYAMNGNGINIFSGKLLPGFYNYGSLQLYLINFTNSVVYLLGGVAKIVPTAIDFPREYDSWGRMLLVGRLIAASMGVWTVGLTYAIGRRLWNERAGLIAALLLAVMPLHAQHSHWLVVDVPTTFWIMLAVYWSTRLMELQDSDYAALSPWKRIRPALLAGLAAGFACATKYNAALALLPVLHATLPARRGTSTGPSTKQAMVWTGTALAAFVLAFLVGCPGSVLDSKQFIHDVGFEAKHVSAQADEPFQQTGSGFVFHVATNLFYGMGWPLLLIALGSLVFAGIRRERSDGLLAVFAVPYYALIGFAVVRYARYAIPLLPILALWSGRMLDALWSSAKLSTSRAGIALTVATVASTAAYAVYYIAPMSKVDPRDQASTWIEQHGLGGQTIAFATMPWFQTASVDPAFGWFMRGGWKQLPYNPPGYESRFIYAGDWDSTIFDSQKPQVVVLSQYEYKDAVRLHRPDALTFLVRLKKDYTPAAEFGGYGKADIGPNGPPHDMMYDNPATWVFVRR